MDVREYHFSRPAEAGADPGPDAPARELPIGRIEETKRGPRFYFTGRLRSPERVLDFALSHPNLVILNEKGEVCDPRRVADEIRGMKIGTAGSGSRFGSGMSVMYNDLSAWDTAARPGLTAKQVLIALLVLSLCLNGVLIGVLGWRVSAGRAEGLYLAEREPSEDAQYLAILEDGTYLHFAQVSNLDEGTWAPADDGLCTLSRADGGTDYLALSPRPGALSVLHADGSITRYEKIRYTPTLIQQAIDAR